MVITTGSVQGSEGMYEWLAQDLAERGYVVLTYDVQGQGTSETLPSRATALPTSPPTVVPASPAAVELRRRHPRRALLLHRHPARPLPQPARRRDEVDAFNPFWRLFDRSRDRRTATPGRTDRIAVIGHSLGAAAVSRVQAVDRRVAAVVALDKLQGSGSFAGEEADNEPVVPALALQAEYGFTVSPWFLSGGSSLTPAAVARGTGPDARAAYRLRRLAPTPASTRCSSSRAPRPTWSGPTSRWCCPPAATARRSRASTCRRWLDRYLKHRDNTGRLLGERFRYLEPTGDGEWTPITPPTATRC